MGNIQLAKLVLNSLLFTVNNRLHALQSAHNASIAHNVILAIHQPTGINGTVLNPALLAQLLIRKLEVVRIIVFFGKMASVCNANLVKFDYIIIFFRLFQSCRRNSAKILLHDRSLMQIKFFEFLREPLLQVIPAWDF